MGVTAEQYGSIPDQPFAGQLTGGNPDLEPEEGETFAAGVVFEPAFIPGLTATLDRWDIDIDGLVGVIDGNVAIRNCLENGDPLFCGLIHRGLGGTLFASEDAYISQLNVNTGSLNTAGWDIMVNYPLELGNFGALNLTLNGTYLDKYEIKPLPTSTPDEIGDCAGYHGFICSKPKPEWRHIANVGWDTPWSDLWLGLTWRYISGVESSRTSSQPALTGPHFPVDRLSARSYLDLAAAWRPRGENWILRGGVNNVFDQDPPLTGVPAADAGANGSTYTLLYDSLGRYLFVSASVEFN
jgi:outer membrane receptor protein involved in Fe transport